MENTRITAYGKDYSYIRNLAGNKFPRLSIYGCGVNGEIICKYLRDLGKEIEFFVDQQAERREFSVLGKRVISPNSFFKMKDDISVIVSPDNQDQVIEFLIHNGIDHSNIICPFTKINRGVKILDDYYSPHAFTCLRKKIGMQECSTAEATVFTILYNTPRGMLCRAIESVLSQSYENFVYLIIDNGSTDASAAIISQYAAMDNRIVYIRLEINVPWTNERLLRILRDNILTPYVAMLDSDDYYEPEFLAKAICTAQNDNAEIVQVNTLTYAHEGFRYSYLIHHLGQDVFLEGKAKDYCLMLRILFPAVWGKLYDSALFNNLIDMMLSYQSDSDRDRNFCLDISWTTYMSLSCSRVSLCDDILHIRTWRPGSSEHSDHHSSKWLSSIVWSFGYLHKCDMTYQETAAFEDSALMWLFSLPRDAYQLSVFRNCDLENRRVAEFLERPICDKYRGA